MWRAPVWVVAGACMLLEWPLDDQFNPILKGVRYVQGEMCKVWLAMKHFAMEARSRRFDPGSRCGFQLCVVPIRWGGHGGQSLVKMNLNRALSLPGFNSVDWEIHRPEIQGLPAVSELEMDCPSLLRTYKNALPGQRNAGHGGFAGCPAVEGEASPQGAG